MIILYSSIREYTIWGVQAGQGFSPVSAKKGLGVSPVPEKAGGRSAAGIADPLRLRVSFLLPTIVRRPDEPVGFFYTSLQNTTGYARG